MEYVYAHIQEVTVTEFGGISEGHDPQQIALGMISDNLRTIDFKVVEETQEWAVVLWSLRQDDLSKQQPLRANKHNYPAQNKKHTREKDYSHQPTPKQQTCHSLSPD
jgi:hypothetical protein